MIVDPDFCDHWKTRLLVSQLDDEAAPVYVLRLWAHCQNRRQWQFDDLPAEALKALCRFPGQANQLESSLSTSGFIRRPKKGMLIVSNWEEYNSSLIASWKNGKKGGRPPKSGPPKDLEGNPQITRGLPVGGPKSSPPIHSSLPSNLDSVLKNSKYDTPDVRMQVLIWEQWFNSFFNKPFSDIQCQTALMQADQKGWTVEKLCRSIPFSINIQAKNWKDPDEDWDEQRKQYANGRQSKAGPGQVHEADRHKPNGVL